MGMAGMGFELAGAVTGFAFLGLWIDRHFDSEPWGLLICAAIGVVGGLYNFVRAAKLAADASNERYGTRTARSRESGESEGEPRA